MNYTSQAEDLSKQMNRAFPEKMQCRKIKNIETVNYVPNVISWKYISNHCIYPDMAAIIAFHPD